MVRRAGWNSRSGGGRALWWRVGLPVGVGLVALNLVVWYLVGTRPSEVPHNSAAASVRLVADEGAVEGLSLYGTARVDRDGGGELDLSVNFFCHVANDVTVVLVTDGQSTEYSPNLEDEFPDEPLTDVSVEITDGGLSVSGTCAPLDFPDVRFALEFPPGRLAVPLSRGQHASGGTTPFCSCSAPWPASASRLA